MAVLPLHVDGKYIKNSNGNVVTLLGCGHQWYLNDPCGNWDGQWGTWNEDVVRRNLRTMKNWGMNHVRLHTPGDYWLADTNNFRNHILRTVQIANEEGLYVIFDLATILNGETMWNLVGVWMPSSLPFVPWTNFPDYGETWTIQDFVNYWVSVANVLKNEPNVIFELYNESNAYGTEPGGVREGQSVLTNMRNQWFSAMQQAITAIRNTGATNLILCEWGGACGANPWYVYPGDAGWQATYAVNMDWIEHAALTGSNLFYAGHTYRGQFNPNWPVDYDSLYAKLQELQFQYALNTLNVPVIDGEFGADDYSGDLEWAANLMSIFNQWGMGYSAWVWTSGVGNCLISSYYPSYTPRVWGQALIDGIAGAQPPSTMALHVEGKYIKNSNGTVVPLLGVRRDGFEGDPSGNLGAPGQFVTSSVITMLDYLKNTWGINCISIITCIQLWKDNTATTMDGAPSNHRTVIKHLAQLCADRGIYLMVEPYSIEPNDGGSYYTGWPYPPYTYYTGDVITSLQDFVDYWVSVSTELKGYSNVIYGIWNEPPEFDYPASMDSWYNGWNSIVNAIRANGDENLIYIQMGFGAYYTAFPLDWVFDPNHHFTQSNLVYGTHLYRTANGLGPDMPYDYDTVKARLTQMRYKDVADNYPLMIGEVGCSLGAGANELTAFVSCLQIFNEWGISYTPWIFNDYGPSGFSLVENCGYDLVVPSTVPRASGQALIDAIASVVPPTPTTFGKTNVGVGTDSGANCIGGTNYQMPNISGKRLKSIWVYVSARTAGTMKMGIHNVASQIADPTTLLWGSDVQTPSVGVWNEFQIPVASRPPLTPLAWYHIGYRTSDDSIVVNYDAGLMTSGKWAAPFPYINPWPNPIGPVNSSDSQYSFYAEFEDMSEFEIRNISDTGVGTDIIPFVEIRVQDSGRVKT